MTPTEAAKSPFAQTAGGAAIGLVIAVLIQFGLIGPTAEKEALQQQANYFELKSQIAEVQLQMSSLEKTIIANTGDRWTLQNEELFAAQLQRDNPEIRVPDPRAIKNK